MSKNEKKEKLKVKCIKQYCIGPRERNTCSVILFASQINDNCYFYRDIPPIADNTTLYHCWRNYCRDNDIIRAGFMHQNSCYLRRNQNTANIYVLWYPDCGNLYCEFLRSDVARLGFRRHNWKECKTENRW